MHKVFACFAAAAFVVLFAARAFAATETVSGRVVDEACYLKDKVHNKFANHKMPADVAGCAVACAKKGRALALLTRDGRLLTIEGGLAANSNAKLVPYVNGLVSITGEVVTKGGKTIITANELTLNWQEDS
jgi:hypothetical protein